AAAQGPFGTLIASGPHVVALMMGLDATFLSKERVALGLGFEFRFVKAVPAGAMLSLEWTVTAIECKPSLGGDIVSVEGRAVDDAGIVYVTATGRNLLRKLAAT
ncbi:MAG TPA: acyl dehydratase, partial [Casimicrobiaceae bacterium]